MVEVLIVPERVLSENNPIIEGTSNRESVTDDIPLTLCTKEEQQFSQVVDQTNELHPPWLAVLANCLSRLEEMGHLGFLSVRITLVDESVELFHRLPNGHVGTSLVVEVVPGFQIVSHGLEGVLLGVEVFDAVAGIVEFAKVRLVFGLVEFRSLVDIFHCLLGVCLQDIHSVDAVGGRLDVCWGVFGNGSYHFGGRFELLNDGDSDGQLESGS